MIIYSLINKHLFPNPLFLSGSVFLLYWLVVSYVLQLYDSSIRNAYYDMSRWNKFFTKQPVICQKLIRIWYRQQLASFTNHRWLTLHKRIFTGSIAEKKVKSFPLCYITVKWPSTTQFIQTHECIIEPKL